MRTVMSVLLLVLAGSQNTCYPNSAAQGHGSDLKSSVPAVRRHAAVVLGRTGDRSAVPALIEALKDPENGVRREAAKALGAIKDGRAVSPLLQALRDADMNVRFYAAYALGEIKSPQAIDALIQAFDDPAWCVRDQAAWALREIHDPKTVEPLVAALKKETADAANVVWLLRHLEDPRTVDHLVALLELPDAATRMRAVYALGELGDQAVLDPLVATLEDDNPEVRCSVIRALVRIGDDRVQRPLKRLAAEDKSPTVREVAAAALHELSRHKDLVAYWSFDDGNAKVAKDTTGHGNDGEIEGCTPVAGKVGQALQFSNGKYIELGQPAGLPISGKALTFMAWVKSEADNGVVIARGGAFCGFSLYIKDRVAKFGIHREQEGPTYVAASEEEVVGPWVHLAGVVKRDTIEVFVNGKLAATTKTDGYIPGNCGQGMEIGFDTANSPAEITDNFQGIIDEVKVYHAALSEEEIAEEYRSGLEDDEPSSPPKKPNGQ